MELERDTIGSLTRAPAGLWWIVEQGFDPSREHEVESRLATANGYLGVRGSVFEGSSVSAPATFLAGVFTTPRGPASVPELFLAPDATRVRVLVARHELSLERGETLEHRRTLDLRDALVHRRWRQRDPAGRILRVEERRAASVSDRHLLLQSIAVTPENWTGPLSLVESPLEGRPSEEPAAVHPPERGEVFTLSVRVRDTGTVVAFALATAIDADRGVRSSLASGSAGAAWVRRWDVRAQLERTARLDRIVAFATSRDSDDPVSAAREAAERALRSGFDAVLEEHVRASRARWREVGAEIEGDDRDLVALRFATHGLLGTASEDSRVSVGARGLTGSSYKGHVFWDTEIYVLPFFTFTRPRVAKSLLGYRHRTLPAARARAAEHGFRGALYAWESADDGRECTPPYTIAPDGSVVPFLSGEHEHHVSADVAYATWTYWQATGDDAFLLDEGAEIVLETARFWASRGALEGDGRFHVRKVIGPDEYHDLVDDDAFTNGMAQWNLERGAEVVELLARRWPERARSLADKLGLGPDEPRVWLDLARATYLGRDEKTGVIEQFEGFFALEDVAFESYRARTASVDFLLGRERTARSKVLKQPDVLMLLALLWDRFSPAEREANFRYYEPLTSHGSSLSPPVHALVAARLGHVEAAQRYFEQTADIDLADAMGNAAGGVHVGALGGLWQAAVLGFGGVSLLREGLALAPALAPGWRALRFPLLWRGRRLEVAVEREPGRVLVHVDGGDVPVALGDAGPALLRAGHRYRSRRGSSGWEPWEEETHGT